MESDLKWYTVRREFIEGPVLFLCGVGTVMLIALAMGGLL